MKQQSAKKSKTQLKAFKLDAPPKGTLADQGMQNPYKQGQNSFTQRFSTRYKQRSDEGEEQLTATRAVMESDGKQSSMGSSQPMKQKSQVYLSTTGASTFKNFSKHKNIYEHPSDCISENKKLMLTVKGMQGLDHDSHGSKTKTALIEEISFKGHHQDSTDSKISLMREQVQDYSINNTCQIFRKHVTPTRPVKSKQDNRKGPLITTNDPYRQQLVTTAPGCNRVQLSQIKQKNHLINQMNASHHFKNYVNDSKLTSISRRDQFKKMEESQNYYWIKPENEYGFKKLTARPRTHDNTFSISSGTNVRARILTEGGEINDEETINNRHTAFMKREIPFYGSENQYFMQQATKAILKENEKIMANQNTVRNDDTRAQRALEFALSKIGQSSSGFDQAVSRTFDSTVSINLKLQPPLRIQEPKDTQKSMQIPEQISYKDSDFKGDDSEVKFLRSQQNTKTMRINQRLKSEQQLSSVQKHRNQMSYTTTQFVKPNKGRLNSEEMVQFLGKVNVNAPKLSQQKTVIWSKLSAIKNRQKAVSALDKTQQTHTYKDGKQFHLDNYKKQLEEREKLLNQVYEAEFQRVSDLKNLQQQADARADLQDVKKQLEICRVRRATLKTRKISNYQVTMSDGRVITADERLAEQEEALKAKHKEIKTILAADQHSIDEALEAIPNQDQLDLGLQMNMRHCEDCGTVMGMKSNTHFLKDPNLFEPIYALRQQRKKQRIENIRRELKNLNDEQKGMNQDLTGLHHANRFEMLQQEELDKFYSWHRAMWARLRDHQMKKGAEGKPSNLQRFQKAVIVHMKQFFIDLELKLKEESSEMESIWVQEKGMAEFQKHLTFVLSEQGDSLPTDEFLSTLMLVRDENERQDAYFENIKELLFPFLEKQWRDKVDDGEIQVEEIEKPPENMTLSKKYKEELINIRERAEYMQKKIPEIHRPRNLENQVDAETKFVQNCVVNLALPLPNMIHGPSLKKREFQIINRGISDGQLQSLIQAIQAVDLSDYNHPSARYDQICLLNNHLSGGQFAQFLSSLQKSQIQSVHSIVYGGGSNELTTESVQAIIDLYLSKKPPFSINELKIIQPRLRDSHLIEKLLQSTMTSLRLENLTLSGVPLSRDSTKMLIKIMEDKMPCLFYLDLSWCRLKTDQLQSLLDSIMTNNYLQDLNIAYNPVSVSATLDSLCTFIRTNSQLQHLNLSGVLQTTQQVKRIVKRAKKSLSLLSLHLSSTPCLLYSSQLQTYIIKKLKLQRIQKPGFQGFQFEDLPSETEEKVKHELMHLKRVAARELEYYHGLQVAAPTEIKSKEHYVLQRTLAHPEVPGNGQWILHDNCYICERWKYTIMFKKKETNQRYRVQGSFQMLNYGTSGKPMVMQDIREVARVLIETTGDQKQDFRRYIDSIHEAYKSLLTDWKQEEIQAKFFSRDLSVYNEFNIWHSIIMRLLKCKKFQIFPQKPAMVELKKMVPDPAQHRRSSQFIKFTDPGYYVLCDYMNPTCHVEKMKFEPIDSQEQVPWTLFIPEVRTENVPRYSLPLSKEQMMEEPFDHAKSVFKPWIKDTSTSLKLTLDMDLLKWKAPRFVKQQSDLEKVYEVMLENFQKLKSLYTGLISCDSYPQIGLNEFTAFARESGITDNGFPQSLVDLQFISATAGSESSSKHCLARNEFLETILRIAYCKYQAGTYHESLQLFLQNLFTSYRSPPWQEFRDQVLWCNRVDRVYRANANNLARVHGILFPRKMNNEMVEFKKCLEVIQMGTDGMVSEKECKSCLGMSKMTVKDEANNRQEYFKLKYVEFLEFLGRVAHIRYSEEHDIDLATKIERLLDLILPMFNLKRVEVPSLNAECVSSDESVTDVAINDKDQCLQYQMIK